ncbi:MAG: nucleoside deaminase [Sedimentisphaerales bacterium]|nr:nucleoside deaminase [Sedimentisphaerales bacterium]NLZ06435.1 nucleoside deaminase [Phycisphaerae bacterium]HNY78410.1 nucleoside deaminase [Sedimentisphaerales bacterium]HOC63611.1 nucleoside deaminase [Sedimentisphaerales bacterium]HOH64451.1 nucleoside deaminase [Sedimentisphaerales bacterium]
MTPSKRPDEVVLRLPQWLRQFAIDRQVRFDTREARMQFVIDLARRNIEHKTGGPFGAAVFEAGSGRLLAPGVNLVEPLNCSIAHAEMVAIAMAQQAIGSYDLGAGGVFCELVTSTEPCAMCLGAIPWSGVRRVLCGARGEDACAIGFDEGAKPGDWVGALRDRGIEVVRDLCRDEARAVLQHYLTAGGRIYNARGEGPGTGE